MDQGISWNLTQHAKIMDSAEVIPFLEEVAEYEGKIPDTDKLNSALSKRGILTKNERDGKSDTWRDYQQVLPTLGLIHSTKIQKEIIVTPIAKALLENQITFEDLISIQILRMQYPNGNSIGNSKNSIWEAQHNAGMKVKPGVMILKTLIELLEKGERPNITINECQKFLISSLDGFVDINALLIYRTQKNRTAPVENKHSRRNIQDWFKLLSKSNIFSQASDGSLFLSELSIKNISSLKALVDKCSVFFWEPTEFDKKDRDDWFNYIGSLPNSEFSLLGSFTTSLALNEDSGRVDAANELDLPTLEIKLGDVSNSLNLNNLPFADKGYAKSGNQKRHEAYNLHDIIIQDIAAVFVNAGIKVAADRNSVDLYAQDDAVSLLIEVKTTNPINVVKQIRLAVGQVLEYSYRLAEPCCLVIVISSLIDSYSYLISFLKQLNISLICWNTYQARFYAASEDVDKIFDKFKECLPDSIKL